MYWFPSASGGTSFSPPVPNRVFWAVHRAPSTKFSATKKPFSIDFPQDGQGFSTTRAPRRCPPAKEPFDPGIRRGHAASGGKVFPAAGDSAAVVPMERVVISLGGSVLVPGDGDPSYLSRLAS